MYSINCIDQNDTTNPVRSYSLYEPEKNNKILKRSAIVFLTEKQHMQIRDHGKYF